MRLPTRVLDININSVIWALSKDYYEKNQDFTKDKIYKDLKKIDPIVFYEEEPIYSDLVNTQSMKEYNEAECKHFICYELTYELKDLYIYTKIDNALKNIKTTMKIFKNKPLYELCWWFYLGDYFDNLGCLILGIKIRYKDDEEKKNFYYIIIII